MKKAYLLVYNDIFGSRNAVRGYLDSMPEITNWRCDLPHCFYLISEASSEVLARRLRKLAGDKGRFLITELADNKFGWLHKRTWYLIKHKQHPPEA